MKNLIYFFLLSAYAFIVSCNNTTEELRDHYISQEEAFVIGMNYLTVNSNNLYSFEMTKKDAKCHNISDNDYYTMLNDVQKTNLFIAKQIHEKVDMEIFNPDSSDYFDIEIKKKGQVRLKTNSESESKIYLGGISTWDQNWGISQIFIPGQINRITITCNSVGFLQGFNVQVGDVAASGIGPLGTWSTDITPNYSNTHATCKFKTTNSNGGTSSFEGYTAP